MWEKKFDGLADHLLGRTIVVDHIDHGIAIAQKNTVRHSDW